MDLSYLLGRYDYLLADSTFLFLLVVIKNNIINQYRSSRPPGASSGESQESETYSRNAVDFSQESNINRLRFYRDIQLPGMAGKVTPLKDLTHPSKLNKRCVVFVHSFRMKVDTFKVSYLCWCLIGVIIPTLTHCFHVILYVSAQMSEISFCVLFFF